MRLVLTLLAATGMLLAGCASSEPDGEAPGRSSSRAAQHNPALPRPDEPISRDPARLADDLAEATAALHEAIDRWRREGDTRARTPREVTLHALHQQRMHLVLTSRPNLARMVIPRLPTDLARDVRTTITARRALARLAPPVPRRRFRPGPALPAGVLLDHYRAAERRFKVAWSVLAAVNFVESAFGRVRNESVAGAQGPMQFIRPTWEAYGMGGDVRDPRDAIMGAANYLHASGAPGDYARALYAYNPSRLYVTAVLAYARRMARDVRAYFAYHSWQVFVRTPSGIRRITGPGFRW
ncbi:MAG: lytic transglycosylase domain-containing protein [Thermoleophilaceae bacterium]|nr:lytic transglycosylase domain-containing protein [Thermoleophilaceae bacterium]